MNETTEMATLLEKLEQSAQTQQRCAKRQTAMITVAAIACVAILVLVVLLYVQVSPVLGQLNTAAEDLALVSQQLADADIQSTVEGLNNTMASAQESLAQGAAKLEQLDIAALNTAINDLAEVVAPLARLFGR